MDKGEVSREIPVTPQMLVAAIKRLQFRRSSVSVGEIMGYICSIFPVCTDKEHLQAEVENKLQVALDMGFIVIAGKGYRLPTLREKSYLSEAGVTAFWERYHQAQLQPPRARVPAGRYAGERPRQVACGGSSSDGSDGSDSSLVPAPARHWSVDTYLSQPSEDDLTVPCGPAHKPRSRYL